MSSRNPLWYVSRPFSTSDKEHAMHEARALQEWLSQNGYYPEAIFSGYFGSLTKNAMAVENQLCRA